MSFHSALEYLACTSAAVSGMVLASGWRRQARVRARGALAPPAPSPPRFEPGQTKLHRQELDAAAEIRVALAFEAPHAARRGVQLEMAVQPGLALHADPGILRDVLSTLVSHALLLAGCERVLVAARLHGGRVQITVSDDGQVDPLATRDPGIQRIMPLLALQGGTIEFDSRPGQGGTVAVRLPHPAKPRAEAAAAARGNEPSAPPAGIVPMPAPSLG